MSRWLTRRLKADGKTDMAEVLTMRPMWLTPMADNVGTQQQVMEAGEKKGSDQRACNSS